MRQFSKKQKGVMALAISGIIIFIILIIGIVNIFSMDYAGGPTPPISALAYVWAFVLGIIGFIYLVVGPVCYVRDVVGK